MSAMDAEFDTLAEWSADAALDLGPDHHLPAGCRGSGGPTTLTLLLDELDPPAGATLLDAGAGAGGPAALAARERQVRPVLLEPEAGACRAARRMFGLPAVRADAHRLPVRDAAVPVAWSLGVLCTTSERTAMLRELRRVVRGDGRVGLLIFVARGTITDPPAGNDFPTPGELVADLHAAGLRPTWRADMPAASDEPDDWQAREQAVTDLVEQRHGDSEAWRTAQQQSGRFGALLRSGDVVGELLVVTPS